MGQTVCSQCGQRPPFVVVEQHLLCLDCWTKWQQAMLAQQEQNIRLMNYLHDLMEFRVGLPGLSPRIELPRTPPTIAARKMTFNNFKIDQSVVGSINTGDIKRLDVAVSQVRVGGNEKLAAHLETLTQAIINSELNSEQKNEALEMLAFLGGQAVLPREGRQASLGKRILLALSEIVSTSGSLVTIWSAVGPHLSSLF